IVLDFKTRGYALKEDTARHYQGQLDVYEYLLQENGFETQPYAYLLFYVPEKINARGEFVFQTHLVKMAVDAGRAKALFRKAIAVLQGDCPTASGDCVFCEWAGRVRMHSRSSNPP
ncbi:MAG: PD-(D/E)XK nuclease family protein, partial [Candidatus Micrarchaeota archaeon]